MYIILCYTLIICDSWLIFQLIFLHIVLGFIAGIDRELAMDFIYSEPPIHIIIKYKPNLLNPEPKKVEG